MLFLHGGNKIQLRWNPFLAHLASFGWDTGEKESVLFGVAVQHLHLKVFKVLTGSMFCVFWSSGLGGNSSASTRGRIAGETSAESPLSEQLLWWEQVEPGVCGDSPALGRVTGLEVTAVPVGKDRAPEAARAEPGFALLPVVVWKGEIQRLCSSGMAGVGFQ